MLQYLFVYSGPLCWGINFGGWWWLGR